MPSAEASYAPYPVTQYVAFANSGTKADPYQIRTASDLQFVSSNSDAYYKLMNDVDLTSWISTNSPSSGWVPIALTGKTFDGNNHKITGLWCSASGTNGGLFTKIENDTIKDLTVEVASGKYVYGSEYTGILAGSVNSVLTNCHVVGNVQSGSKYTGGITGMLSGKATNCTVTGNVSGKDDTGGIAGSSSAYITNCMVTGNINGGVNTGGIAGESQQNITKCTYKGTIVSTGTVGGIIGTNSSTVDMCTDSCSVTNSGSSSYTGGLVGYNSGNVTNSASAGSVKATGADSNAGGLVGYSSATGNVNNDYSTSDVTGTAYTSGGVGYNYGPVTKCYASGNVSGSGIAGGIVGYNDGTAATTSACIALCPTLTAKTSVERVVGGIKNNAPTPGSNNYALSTMAVSLNSVPQTIYDDVLEGIAKTLTLAQTSSTYVQMGWDLTNVWNIESGVSYPYLRNAGYAKPVVKYTGAISYYKADNTLLTSTTASVSQGSSYALPSGTFTYNGNTYPIASIKVNSTVYTSATYTPTADFAVNVYLGEIVYKGKINYYKADNTLLTTDSVSVKQGNSYTTPSGTFTYSGNTYPIASVKINGTVYTETSYTPAADFAVNVYLSAIAYTGTVSYYKADNTLLATETVNVAQGSSYTLPTGTYTSGSNSYPISSIKVNGTAYTDATYTPEANFSVGVYLEAITVTIPDNSLYINDTTFSAGKQIVLPIRMKNSDNAITAIKTDLYLPTGFTIAKDADNLEMIELGTRTTLKKHSLDWLGQTDGAMRILCASTKLSTFTGNDGIVFNVTIDIASTVADGDYSVYMKNTEVTNTSSVVHKTSEAESKITIKSYKLGDVNDDSEINTGDYVSMASYLIGSTPTTFIQKAADLTGDGEINTGDLVYMAGVLLGSNTLTTSSVKAFFATATEPDPTTNNIQIIPFSIEPGEEKTINVEMNNPDKPCTAILFNLVMPDGISIEKDADNLPLIDFGSRTTLKKHTLDTNEVGGATRVLIASSKLNLISGTSGTLVTVTIKASDDLKPGVYTIALKDMEMTSTDSKVFKPYNYNASVLSGSLIAESTLPNLYGNYTTDAITALNSKIGSNSSITSVDLSNATDIASAATLNTANENTLFYLPEGKSVANTTNVVSGKECTKLLLTEDKPFAATKAFTAASASYTRNTTASGWYSLCLPFATTIPSGVSIEKYESVDKAANTVTFISTSSPEANIPYIFKTSEKGDVTFTATNVNVPATTNLTDGYFTGTFSTLQAGTIEGKYALKADGSGFAMASATAYVSPFRAYLNENLSAKALSILHNDVDGISAPVHGLSITTGKNLLTVKAYESQDISIASIDGRIIAHFSLAKEESNSLHLASGIYFVNRTKVLVK
jgi:hypothetical protein